VEPLPEADIYSVNADGSDLVRLTEDPTADSNCVYGRAYRLVSVRRLSAQLAAAMIRAGAATLSVSQRSAARSTGL